MQFWLALTCLNILLCLLNLLNAAPAFNLPLVPELTLLSICIWTFVYFGYHVNIAPLKNRNAALRFAMILCVALVLLTMLRAVAAHGYLQTLDPLCSANTGFVPRLECLFQAGIDQNPSLRQLTYLLIACVLSATGYRSAQCAANPNFIPWAFVVHSVLFVALTAILFVNHAELPGFFIGQEYAISRFAILMENPTWVWPLLIPALISIFHLNNTVQSILARSLLLIAVLGIFALFLFTQQRGAIIAASWTVIWLVAAYTVKNSRHSRALAGYLLAFLAVCGTAAIITIERDVLLSRFLDKGFHTGRTSMWGLALTLMSNHWLLGHGHGSWFREFGEKALAFNIDALDTAHNFFIQTLFELGLIHLTALLAVPTITLYVFTKKLWLSNRALLATMIHALGLWTLALSVQEIDFVRSVYYSNAICLGWLIGIISRQNLTIEFARRDQPFKMIYGLSSAAATAILISAIFLLSKFSIGGYQFEADYRSDFKTKVRWLRPVGTLGSYIFHKRPSDIAIYSVYPVVKTLTEKLEIKRIGEDWKQIPIHPRPDQESFLPVPIQKWYQLPVLYRSKKFDPYASRFLAVLLGWPSAVSSLPFISAKGFLPWEISPIDGLSIRWCEAECSAQLLDCWNPEEHRVLTIMAARPDVSLSTPLHVEYIDTKSSQRIEFDTVNQKHELKIHPSERFKITVSSIYHTPQDMRPKGILFTGSECRRN